MLRDVAWNQRKRFRKRCIEPARRGIGRDLAVIAAAMHARPWSANCVAAIHMAMFDTLADSAGIVHF